jgi:carboxyl-terminal processing protease
LQEAINLCGLLIGNKRSAVYLRERESQAGYAADERIAGAWKGPLVVLTSSLTAGGAEIMAAAVKDHRAGLVFGSPRTFGMGVSKGRFELTSSSGESLGQAHIVTTKSYRVTGESLQGRGVPSDVILPVHQDLLTVTEDQRPYSLANDRIKVDPLPARTSAITESLVAQLAKSSEARRADNRYFQELKELERWQAELKGKGVTLQREKYLAERRAEAHEKEKDKPLPGIPEVVLDGRLREALKTALEFAAKAR